MSDVFRIKLKVAVSTPTEPQRFILFLAKLVKLLSMGPVNNIICCALKNINIALLLDSFLKHIRQGRYGHQHKNPRNMKGTGFVSGFDKSHNIMAKRKIYS